MLPSGLPCEKDQRREVRGGSWDSPPEKLERHGIEAGVMHRGETVRVRVFDGRREPLLELFVGRLGTDDEILCVVQEYTCIESRVSVCVPSETGWRAYR